MKGLNEAYTYFKCNSYLAKLHIEGLILCKISRR